MLRHLLVVCCVVLAVSCGNVGTDADGGEGGGTGTGTGGSGATGGGSGATGGGSSTGGGLATGGSGSTGGGSGSVTWCNVQPVVQSACGSCHGTTPNPGAPALVTAAQFRAASPVGGTYLDRSIIRMGTTPVSGAMPPSVGGTPQQLSLFTSWRSAGAPDCPSNTGGGAGTGGGVATGGGTGSTGGGTATGGGGGSVMTTCTSNSTWLVGNSLGIYMNPGEACRSCHQSMGKGPVDGFMGTVYPSLHEAKLCTVPLFGYQSGVTVEILDSAGTVAQTFQVSGTTDGNFHGGPVGMPSPYRARVKVNGTTTSEMTTLQTDGDCNTCHTPLGANGAPGRIHY